ncbi:IS1380 family transposase, partial [Acidithiobacillus sp. IBUN Pt1247-S3]
MSKMAQSVLPFQLQATEESMTAQAGLTLFGEYLYGIQFSRWVEREMPKPGSGHAYAAIQQALPLVLMLTGGGRSLEDLRMIHADPVLRRLLHLDALPSTDATGDWLRRTGAGAGLDGLSRVNQRVVARRLRKLGRHTHTLDMDATQILAEKRTAEWTYKGERGYMPMVGHLAEAGVVIHDD